MKKKAVDIDLQAVGSRIKAIRKKLQLMQRDFVKIVNITMSTLSDIETGKKRPGSEMLFILSDVYQVNLHYILHGEGEMFRTGKEVSGITIADNIFGEYTDDFKEILWYMQHSLLFRAAVIVFGKDYLLRNELLIERDIRRKEEKNKEMENKNEK
ncbi:MAG: helix-turn-helix domain-containing protein [Acidobacteria bacterium]|jgi:transcriptional regulator with XRE-family HTH domain|nr:helix-turn-helix domain-containing protein [Acidobacteriota bacterium]